MKLGTIPSGYRSLRQMRKPKSLPAASLPCPGHKLSAASASYLRVVCVSPVSLNFQLSTFDDLISAQLACFHNVPHPFVAPQDTAPLFSYTYEHQLRVTPSSAHTYEKCRVCTSSHDKIRPPYCSTPIMPATSPTSPASGLTPAVVQRMVMPPLHCGGHSCAELC
jgi:hypothetical protein